MGRIAFVAVAGLLVLATGSTAAAAEASARVGVFYYPWYGTPRLDGGYHHWTQRGHRPPRKIASSYYPSRGIYSSSDVLVLTEQLGEIRAAGVDQLIVSWWGRGSLENARLDRILVAADALGLSVAAHVEPYRDRSPASVVEDLDYLVERGVSDVYLYEPHTIPAQDWAPVNERHSEVRVFAQTALVGYAARGGFDGLYTYDILIHGAWKFGRLCAHAHRKQLACAPSVGPGYDARRAVGDMRLKPRRDGLTYDSMWIAAIEAGADAVTITSYNEWHEGTQIEPARPQRGYEGYDGAWGRTGANAERAYLDRTVYWSNIFTG